MHKILPNTWLLCFLIILYPYGQLQALDDGLLFGLDDMSVKASAFSQVTSDPSTWIIKRDYLFNADGQLRNSYLRELIQQLESYQGEGSRVRLAEFEQLLSRRETKQVYIKELVRYATPKSRKRQNQAHKNLLKVVMQKKRLRAGVKFIRKYDHLLKRAQKRYGVARQDIVSILMWESNLGKFTGHLRIFNVFMGQLLFLEVAQQYAVKQMLAKGKENPLKSAKMIVKEKQRFQKIKKRAIISLVALLRQSKAKGIDPLTVKGSWGGAIGYVQFMPYRMNYAVDGNQDGIIDLNSWSDAIFSVANYLKNFGNYDSSYNGRKKGIFSYNHSNSYVDGVIAYADAIWKIYNRR